ncbi:hypothetical protein JL722_11610 [Aureococcus anophagefferens]|nr:hypothetical protein JL722_11610 [Aureococcus anophagefferens]
MSSLATTTEAATRSPQSLASGGDDEGWRDAALRQRDAAVVERDAAVEALRSQTLANAPPPGRWRGRGLDDADRGRVAAGLVGDEVLNGEVGEILNGGYDDYPEPPPLVVDRDLARPPSAPGRRGGGDGQRRRSPSEPPRREPRAASVARARTNGEAPPRTNGDRAAPYADGDRPSRRARVAEEGGQDRGAAPERRAKPSPRSAYDGGEAGPSGQERRRSDARRLAELVRATAVVVDRVEHCARDLAARCDRSVRKRDAGAPPVAVAAAVRVVRAARVARDEPRAERASKYAKSSVRADAAPRPRRVAQAAGGAAQRPPLRRRVAGVAGRLVAGPQAEARRVRDPRAASRGPRDEPAPRAAAR